MNERTPGLGGRGRRSMERQPGAAAAGGRRRPERGPSPPHRPRRRLAASHRRRAPAAATCAGSTAPRARSRSPINPWVGRRGQRRRRRSACSSTSSATRSRRARSPRRSPGRASRPATSTSILENWGHPDLEKTYITDKKVAQDAGPNGVTGIIGWYVPQWMVDKYPDIPDWNNLNKYADLFKTTRVRRQGPVPRQRPDVRHQRRGAHREPQAELQGRSTPAARPRRSRRSSRPPSNKTPLIGYFYDPQWLHSEIKLVKVKLPAYTAGLRRRPQDGRMRLPAVHAQQDRRDEVRRDRRRRVHARQELHVDERGPEHGRRLHHQPEHDARRTPRKKWVAGQPHRVEGVAARRAIRGSSRTDEGCRRSAGTLPHPRRETTRGGTEGLVIIGAGIVGRTSPTS